MSNMSGRVQRIDEVTSAGPRPDVAGGALYSATITTVGGPIALRGSWFGVALGRASPSAEGGRRRHAVRGHRRLQRVDHPRAGKTNVERDRPRARKKPIEMGIQEQQPAQMQAQPLPNPVAQAKPASKTETFASARGTRAPFR